VLRRPKADRISFFNLGSYRFNYTRSNLTPATHH
jgi:hypothetical protein